MLTDTNRGLGYMGVDGEDRQRLRSLLYRQDERMQVMVVCLLPLSSWQPHRLGRDRTFHTFHLSGFWKIALYTCTVVLAEDWAHSYSHLGLYRQ